MAVNRRKRGPDVILVGAGVMSSTLAILLKELNPDLKIEIYETLNGIAEESSHARNNAGTGHAALCELNYTPELEDGSVDCTKAYKINETFKISQQFWAYLVEKGAIKPPKTFINPIPHLSFVWGEENVAYLRKRYEILKQHHLFKSMQFSEDPLQLKEWMPIVMEGREVDQKVAANRVAEGTDMDFGALSRSMMDYVQRLPGVVLYLEHDVINVRRALDGRWQIQVVEKETQTRRRVSANFLFLGAGGGALPLLQKSGIPEGKTYGGFPVSGMWLRCKNPDLIARHQAKVYGKAAVGAPPMSVPHLDTRIIDGEKSLLFGPYAGFSTKFLKNGSLLDMPKSVTPDNLIPMLAAGIQNVELTKYLIAQVVQTPEQRLEALKDFLPSAQLDDWELAIAGQRVQIIKKDPKLGGVLQFGTEVICSKDGSLASLLGASPGASSAVSAMLQVIAQCFPEPFKSPAWQSKLREMIPSHGQSLIQDEALARRVESRVSAVLGLNS